jgi:hypothetical protein
MDPAGTAPVSEQLTDPSPVTTIFVAGCWGCLLGMADAIATLARHGEPDTESIVTVLLAGPAVVGALSVLVGAILDLAGRILRLRWAQGGLYRRGQLWVPRRNILTLWMGVMALMGSLSFIAFPVRPPLGLHRVVAGVVCGALLLAVVVVVHRASERRWVERSAWVGVVLAALYLEVHTLYQFSRLWPTWSIAINSNSVMSFSHTAGLVLVIVLLTSLTCMFLPPRHRVFGVGSRVVRWAVLGLAATIFLASRPSVSFADPQAAVLLYQRSVLAFRALEVAPRFQSAPKPDVDDEPAPAPWAQGATQRKVRGVLIVLVDALRADMLDAEVDGRPVAPSLRKFGASAVQFDRAYCTVPATTESVAAMLTGRRDAHLEPRTLQERSVAPLLRAAGVTTVGIYGHDALLDTFAWMDRPIPFGNGATNKNRLTSDITLAEVQRQLDALQGEPFLLVAHFYDPHSHYLPNPEFDFGTSAMDAYMGEVAYTDRRLGRLFDMLRDSGLDREVAVMVVSDHGEEIWDHGYRWHRKAVYEESARVVLQIRTPSSTPAVVDRPVSLLDVAPTVLDLLGAPIPDDVDGISLVPVLEGQSAPERPIVVTAGDDSALAVVDGHRKLIVHTQSHAMEYFDLRRDPGEERNLVDDHPEEVDRLLRWIGIER